MRAIQPSEPSNIRTYSLGFEKLNNRNYPTWKQNMKGYLMQHDLWEVIQESSTVISGDRAVPNPPDPPEPIRPTQETITTIAGRNPSEAVMQLAIYQAKDTYEEAKLRVAEHKILKRNRNRALGIFINAIDESKRPSIALTTNPGQAWDILHQQWNLNGKENTNIMRVKLNSIKLQPGTHMSNHLDEIRVAASRYTDADGTLTDSDLYHIIMNSLPDDNPDINAWKIPINTMNLDTETLISKLHSFAVDQDLKNKKRKSEDFHHVNAVESYQPNSPCNLIGRNGKKHGGHTNIQCRAQNPQLRKSSVKPEYLSKGTCKLCNEPNWTRFHKCSKQHQTNSIELDANDLRHSLKKIKHEKANSVNHVEKSSSKPDYWNEEYYKEMDYNDSISTFKHDISMVTLGTYSVRNNVENGPTIELDLITHQIHSAEIIEESKILMDSGASIHVTNRMDLLENCVRLKYPEQLIMGNGAVSLATFKGTLVLHMKFDNKINTWRIPNVLFCEDIRNTLLSTSELCNEAYKVTFEGRDVFIHRHGELKACGEMNGRIGLYTIPICYRAYSNFRASSSFISPPDEKRQSLSSHQSKTRRNIKRQYLSMIKANKKTTNLTHKPVNEINTAEVDNNESEHNSEYGSYHSEDNLTQSDNNYNDNDFYEKDDSDHSEDELTESEEVTTKRVNNPNYYDKLYNTKDQVESEYFTFNSNDCLKESRIDELTESEEVTTKQVNNSNNYNKIYNTKDQVESEYFTFNSNDCFKESRHTDNKNQVNTNENKNKIKNKNYNTSSRLSKSLHTLGETLIKPNQIEIETINPPRDKDLNRTTVPDIKQSSNMNSSRHQPNQHQHQISYYQRLINQYELTHAKLGHYSIPNNLHYWEEKVKHACDLCLLTKATNCWKHGPSYIKAIKPLQLLHMDLMGPMITSGRGNKYILAIIDDYSLLPTRSSFVIFMTSFIGS